MSKVPFPKCQHPDRPQHTEETSYEYFESACEECYMGWKREQHLALVKEWRESGAVFELNQWGRYTVFADIKNHKPSNRADGRWIVGSISREEYKAWEKP